MIPKEEVAKRERQLPEIIRRYESGEVSVEEITKQYRIPRTTLYRYFKDIGIKIKAAPETVFNFKKWTKIRASYPLGSNEVSISKTGDIYISRELVTSYFNDSWVEIYYDDEAKMLGLKPRKDRSNAYKIGKKLKTYKVAAKKILTHLRVKPQRYKAEWTPELEMLIIHYLKDEVSEK